MQPRVPCDRDARRRPPGTPGRYVPSAHCAIAHVLTARVAQVKQLEAQLACASGPVPPPPAAADRAVDESAAATSADSSVVVVGERSGSMAFPTSVGDGIDQEVMRRARSSHTLRSARACVFV